MPVPQLGYGFGNLDLDPTQIGDVDADGALGGFTAGYTGIWVTGFWASRRSTTGRTCISNDTGASEFHDFFRLKARAGRDLGNTLIYASAGAVYSNFSGATNVLDIDWNDPGLCAGRGRRLQAERDLSSGWRVPVPAVQRLRTDGNDVDVNGVMGPCTSSDRTRSDACPEPRRFRIAQTVYPLRDPARRLCRRHP